VAGIARPAPDSPIRCESHDTICIPAGQGAQTSETRYLQDTWFLSDLSPKPAITPFPHVETCSPAACHPYAGTGDLPS